MILVKLKYIIAFSKERLLKDWFLSDVNKELEVNSLRSRIKQLEEKYEKKE